MQALQVVTPNTLAAHNSSVKPSAEIPRLNIDLIHEKAMSLAENIKSKYLEFFEVLLEVEFELIYLQFEVPSLYRYCVDLLELSPQITNDFIVVVRKSLEIPALAEAVRSKKITISKARKICPVLTVDDPAKWSEWIELAANCSTRTIEKCVAQANPKEAVTETLTYASEERLDFRLGVSEEWADLLTQTKDLLSQQFKRNVDSEEALFILMKSHCTKNDPVEKAARSEKRKIAARPKISIQKKIGNELTVKLVGRTGRHLPASIEHEVTLRDQNQCTYVNREGERCDSRRWLHKHHIKHFADGGRHTADNLETLCSGHHRIKHFAEIGRTRRCHVTPSPDLCQ